MAQIGKLGDRLGERRRGKREGKGKQVRTPDSTPLTRQGYRSRRLADDFWLALKTPHTPLSPRKTLSVIPILAKTRNDEEVEYLTNTKADASRAITQVHIVELLAGVPWTESRVRQHVVSEAAQALYKVIGFTNPSQNPLQKWKHGKWFANWEEDKEGEYICTLYVWVATEDNKLKPRKGHSHGWSRVPIEIEERVRLHIFDSIEAITEDKTHWHNLLHSGGTSSSSGAAITTTQNQFAVLRRTNTLQN